MFRRLGVHVYVSYIFVLVYIIYVIYIQHLDMQPSRPVMKFTEEFDFMAMNEKFNKDEVWGHLGESSKSNLKEKEGDGNAREEDYSKDEDNIELPKSEVKVG